MPGLAMSPMTDGHRLFLQTFMSKGILSGTEVKDSYKRAVDRFPEEQQEDLVGFVRTINENILPFNLVIKKGVSEDINGKHFYGLVNTAETDITRLSPMYSVNELELFKKIVEQVVESEKGTVSSVDILNMTESLQKKMTKHDAQELLDRLERDKWLSMNDGEYCLSTRSVLELDQYIFQQYPNLAIKCNMCTRLCLQGQSCDQCDVKLHMHCAATFFKNQSNPTCPDASCGAAWRKKIPELPRQRDPSGTQSSQSSSRSQRSEQAASTRRSSTRHK